MPTMAEIRSQYPQYGDMTDEQLAQSLHTKYYSDLPFEDFAGRVGLQPSRTVPQQLGRQAVGLPARYAVEGAAALPALVANAPAALMNLGLEAAGVDYRFPEQGAALSNALTRLGLPQPETKTERVVGDVSRAVAAAGTSMGAGRALQQAQNPVTAGVGRTLQVNPDSQLQAAVGGATASGVTRENDGSPLAQFLAGLTGAVATPTAIEASRSLGRGLTSLLGPFFSSGQQQVAADVLASQVDDVAGAAGSLARYNQQGSVSQQTAGPASRDIGMLALEKARRAAEPGRFGQRLSEQNAARQTLLDSIAGTKADIERAATLRGNETRALREAAFAASRSANVDRVTAAIDDTMRSPAGKREAVGAAMTWLRGLVDGETDPARLYSTRKDIGDAMTGKYGGDKGFILARKELGAVREVLDEVIEDAAPGFRAYLSRYRELSKPINQMEVLQEIQRRSRLAAPDVVTGRDFLSQAKFRNAVERATQSGDLDVLTPQQSSTLRAVAADLDMGAAIGSASLRAPGSDTFQNMSVASVISAAWGRNVRLPQPIQSLARPFSFLYRQPDERINEILTDAMLDPKLAEMLLRRATPQTVAPVAARFRAFATATAAGGAAQTASTSPRSSAAER
jgi:hypothetical protein